MTMEFFSASELIKRLVNKKINENMTIIDVKTRKEYDLKTLLSMKLLEIKSIQKFAVC